MAAIKEYSLLVLENPLLGMTDTHGQRILDKATS